MVIITPYTGTDTEEILSLILEIQQGEYHISITREDQPDLSDIASFYQIPGGAFFLARKENQIVGTIGMLNIGNGQGALRKMFVHKEYRGSPHKTAEQLLRTLETWARNNGFREIFLGTTDRFIGAHKFYDKHQFTRLPKEDLPPAFPIMKVDSLFFYKELE